MSNLGAALAKKGKGVTVIDGNVTGANLGMHLGLPSVVPISINDVVKNDAFITHAIYKHPAGFSVIPAALDELATNFGGLRKHMKPLLGANDFILIDSAAGIDREVEAAVDASDAVLIVTNPEHPAVAGAIGAKNLAEKKGKEVLGVVLNKVMREGHELTERSVESLTGLPVLAVLHDHRKVREAIANRNPIVIRSPGHKTSRAVMGLASQLCGEKVEDTGFFAMAHEFVSAIMPFYSSL